MLRETTRPLTKSERDALEQRARWRVNDDLGGALTFFVVLGVVGGAIGNCAGRVVPHGLPIALAIAFALWIAATRTNLRARRKEKDAYRRDLANGEARVIHVEDAEVFVREERGSEGPTFVLRVSDSRVLVLSGQWLYGIDHAFPARAFELASAPVSRFVLGVDVLDPAAPEQRKLEAAAIAIEDLGPVEVLDVDHPAIRDAFSEQASGRGRRER
jgi:hypothetical protein